MATRAPAPLPSGWLLKESVSNPFHFFYYNQFSGESTWSKPPDEVVAVHNDINENSTESETAAKVGDKRSAGDQASKCFGHNLKKHLHGHNSPVDCVALRSNGHVASGSRSGSIIIHSTSSNKVEYQADNVFALGVEDLCYLLDGSGLVAMMMMMMRVPT